MEYRVLKDFPAKKRMIKVGEIIMRPIDHPRTKLLLDSGHIELLPQEYDWEERPIKSVLAKVLIAPEDYKDGGREHFTWDQAVAIQERLNNGWRLPTRSEWALICEEFGQKDGRLDADTMIDNLHLGRNGSVYNGSLNNAGSYGYYWSSTSNSATNAYYLNFSSGGVTPSSNHYRYYGLSVRLVKDIKEN